MKGLEFRNLDDEYDFLHFCYSLSTAVYIYKYSFCESVNAELRKKCFIYDKKYLTGVNIYFF